METTTDKQAALYTALSLAQAEVRNAVKDAKNPHYKSDYATLASVLDTVREPLTSNGLAITQLVQAVDGRNMLVTMLVHRDGGHIIGNTVLPEPQGSNISQAFAAIVTYFRRVTIAALCGIAQADDDGETIVAPKPASPKPDASPKPASPKPTPKQTLSQASVDKLRKAREDLALTTEGYLAAMRKAGFEYQFLGDGDVDACIAAVQSAIVPPAKKAEA